MVAGQLGLLATLSLPVGPAEESECHDRGRDMLYYVRALEEARPAIMGNPLRSKRGPDGRVMRYGSGLPGRTARARVVFPALRGPSGGSSCPVRSARSFGSRLIDPS